MSLWNSRANKDLNQATPKDEYPMPVAEMLVDSAIGFEYLSMLDDYSGYNQIYIVEEDVSKTLKRIKVSLEIIECVPLATTPILMVDCY